MKFILSKMLLSFLPLSVLGFSMANQILPQPPLTFYPQNKSFFYSEFCKKYQCTFGSYKKANLGTVFENFGLLNTSTAALLNIDTVRQVLSTPSWWYTGINLMINPKYHYDKFYVNAAKSYINSDIQAVMSDLLFAAVGKKYSKDQLVKCMNADRRMNRSYFLEEFMKFPTSAPIGKLPSGHAGDFTLSIECGVEKNSVFSITLE
jgi:hypothetical protein